ncbi:methionine ABC transporter substrate-binding protein MetQ [Dyadobacter luteus]|jgi:D-methionine transport system substrate-binding protein|uniref:Lipoprotein n=1 Tax=Dyadobacter luteus TaxID=2259619 RepID=A0A3D8YEP5_9BACT|nr:methionine ABC transporter substrate-binding lipoprotein MetQ [Dyadobacter luteus]REA63066.1 methionine ABC transporter substrate-binding protein MetQ [Dyadobacter luteus]
MKIANQIYALILLAAGTIAVSGCSKKAEKNNDPNHIKVGIAVGPEYEVAQVAQKVAKEKYGLDVELITFNDYVVPNEALSHGDVDINAFQHKPYLDQQVAERGYKLAIVGNTFVYPIAGYSKKIKSLQELAAGATVAIPNDPTNGGRSLLLLEKYKLIKLKPGIGLLPKVIDIAENPRNLKILELEAPQLPLVLDDKEVSLAIINNNFAAKAGLISTRDGLLIEDKDSPYVNLIVAREDNKNEEKVKKYVQAYQSAEVLEAAERIFKGGAVKGW